MSAVAPFRGRCFGVAIVVILCCAPDAWAQQKNVLVLHATRADARIAVLADLQLVATLERGLGQRVNHSSTYLELAKFGDAEYRSATTDFLRVKYRGQHFDLVIALHETVSTSSRLRGRNCFPGRRSSSSPPRPCRRGSPIPPAWLRSPTSPPRSRSRRRCSLRSAGSLWSAEPIPPTGRSRSGHERSSAGSSRG